MTDTFVKIDDEKKTNEVIELVKDLDREEVSQLLGYAQCLSTIRFIREKKQSSA